MDDKAFADWFGSNTMVISVDTAITAKDRFHIGERARLKDRAAFLLAKKLIEKGYVATTVGRALTGDVIRVQVQVVNPAVWCEADGKVFEEVVSSPGVESLP